MTGSTGKIAQGDMSRQIMVKSILESKQVWVTAPILSTNSLGDCRSYGWLPAEGTWEAEAQSSCADQHTNSPRP